MNLTIVGVVDRGIKEVTVLVDTRPYTFELDSQYALEEFYRLHDSGHNGKALNWLKKYNVRGKGK